MRTARNLRARLQVDMERRRFVEASRHRFANDTRFHLSSVRRGFAPRLDDGDDDREILKRICKAYACAIEAERTSDSRFRATAWWAQMRQLGLRDVIQALQTRDLAALQKMYRNFFRDPCSTGLIALPYGMHRNGSTSKMRPLHFHHHLGNALHAIDYWKEQTNARYRMTTLLGPDTGNPFGVIIDGTFIRTGTPYQHYCATRIAEELGEEIRVVAEIGGGYGGMAFYLLRDVPGLRYIDLDVPESLALTAFYLMKSLPEKTFLLFGEDQYETSQPDVTLLPLHQAEKLLPRSVGVTFSSHAISDQDPEALEITLQTIARVTRGRFLHIGKAQAANSIEAIAHDRLRPEQTRKLGWNETFCAREPETETVYAINRQAILQPQSAGAS
jgi:hypothetical protein